MMNDLREENFDELGNEDALLDDSIFEESDLDDVSDEELDDDISDEELDEAEEILDELDALLAEEEDDDMDFYNDEEDF